MATPIIGFYSLLAGAAVMGALSANGWVGRCLFGWAAFGFALVVAAYARQRPGCFGKRANGAMAWWAWMVHGPYFALSHLALVLYRALSGEKPFHEVAPGLFLGCRLWPADHSHLARLQVSHILDLTSEFSEAGSLRGGREYVCLPLLDHGAPDEAGLHAGVDFLRQALREGKVYVHCAVGHGRSATMVAAYLLATGRVSSADEALRLLRSTRPGVRLNRAQRAALGGLEERLKGGPPR